MTKLWHTPYQIKKKKRKKKAKLSQYADDTNPFVLTEQSIIEILNFFGQYNLAT